MHRNPIQAFKNQMKATRFKSMLASVIAYINAFHNHGGLAWDNDPRTPNEFVSTLLTTEQANQYLAAIEASEILVPRNTYRIIESKSDPAKVQILFHITEEHLEILLAGINKKLTLIADYLNHQYCSPLKPHWKVKIGSLGIKASHFEEIQLNHSLEKELINSLRTYEGYSVFQSNHFLWHQLYPKARKHRPTVSPYKIPMAQLVKGEEIGKGEFGKVYKGSFTNTGGVPQTVAIKICDKSSISEIESMITLANAPYTVHLVAYANDRVFAMTFAENGNLTRMIGKLNESQQVNIMYGTSEALAYLHRIKLVHRDIKPDNILLNAQLDPMLGDFGFTTNIATALNDEARGTPLFMAPELLSHCSGGTQASDIYSFGFTMWCIIQGVESPFPEITSLTVLTNLVTAGCREPMPVCLPELQNLIQAAWANTPTLRPRADEVVKILKNLKATIQNGTVSSPAPNVPCNFTDKPSPTLFQPKAASPINISGDLEVAEFVLATPTMGHSKST